MKTSLLRTTPTTRKPDRNSKHRMRKELAVLTASSSNVINISDHLEPRQKASAKPRWGKAGCSDWLAANGADMSPAEFKAVFFLSRRADQWTGDVGDPVKGISPAYLATVSGMDERQIDRSLDAIAKRGLLEKTPGKRGRGKAAKYKFVEPGAEFSIEALAERLISDIGATKARGFIDLFEGDTDSATAVLRKICWWNKARRIAYLDEMLNRRFT